MLRHRSPFLPKASEVTLMKKIRLDPENLRVESYVVNDEDRLRPGTVFGHSEGESIVTCKSCDFSGCDRTCVKTCYDCEPVPTAMTV
jgi:hypothetical protein